MNNNSKKETEHTDPVLNAPADPEEAPVRRIKTYDDLLQEEQRLTMRLKREKTTVVTSMHQLKSKLEPATNLMNSVSSVFGVKEKPGVVAQGVDMVMDLVTKKYLFKRSGWLMTLVGSYAVRGISQFILRNKKNKESHDGVPVLAEREHLKRSKI